MRVPKLMKAFYSIKTPDAHYKWVCGNYPDITGYDRDFPIGKSAYDFFHPDDLNNILTSHFNVKDRVQETAYRFRKSSGEYIWLIAFSLQIKGEIVTLHLKLNWFHIFIFKLIDFFKSFFRGHKI